MKVVIYDDEGTIRGEVHGDSVLAFVGRRIDNASYEGRAVMAGPPESLMSLLMFTLEKGFLDAISKFLLRAPPTREFTISDIHLEGRN